MRESSRVFPSHLFHCQLGERGANDDGAGDDNHL
jgi:hypothetical protein